MRSAGNFHPEWGYLAPATSFVRTLRIVAVATAIGATAGAAVVVSLVARPAESTANSSIAAHALVTGAPVADAAAVKPAAVKAAAAQPVPAQRAPAQQTQAAALSPPAAAAPPQQDGAPPAQTANAPDAAVAAAPAQAAQIEEPAAAPVREDAAPAPEAAPNKKAETKKHRLARYEPMRHWQNKRPQQNGGRFDPLFRLFSSRGGSTFWTN